jgi:hypothetical protein
MVRPTAQMWPASAPAAASSSLLPAAFGLGIRFQVARAYAGVAVPTTRPATSVTVRGLFNTAIA